MLKTAKIITTAAAVLITVATSVAIGNWNTVIWALCCLATGFGLCFMWKVKE